MDSARRVEEVKSQRDRISTGGGGRLSLLVLVTARNNKKDGSRSIQDSTLSFTGARRRIYGRRAGDSFYHFNRYIRRMDCNPNLVGEEPRPHQTSLCGVLMLSHALRSWQKT